MDALTNSQRKYLKKLAHHLKPSVQIGKSGATDQVRATLDQVLAAHELAKVRFVGSKDEKKTIAERLSRETGAHLVQIIGHVAVFYRQNADSASRQIDLPA